MFTQGDGQFDLVVEAGRHTVEFTRADLLPAYPLVNYDAANTSNVT